MILFIYKTKPNICVCITEKWTEFPRIVKMKIYFFPRYKKEPFLFKKFLFMIVYYKSIYFLLVKIFKNYHSDKVKNIINIIFYYLVSNRP